MTSSALIDFGKAVRKARTAKGWTLEMLAHEALGNQERKSYVSAVERGKKRLSALTVQKFARALDLPDDVVDPVLHHAAPQDEPATQSETEADQLFDELEGLRHKLKISESLAIALAVKHAEGNPSDLDGALRELERAFEVARDQAMRGALSSNTDAAVDAVIAEVDRLNEDEGLEAGSAYLNAELERMAAQHVRLIDKALAQAVMARDVEAAVALELQKLRLDGEGDFAALRALKDTWYVRGRDKGLRFDLEVSIGLAQQLVARAKTQDESGNALNDLGVSLSTLGERETGPSRLEKAVTAYRASLEERTRNRVPLEWASTQNNLGNALQTLGQRETGTDRLEEAVTTYRAALEERRRDRVPLNWAFTQGNLCSVELAFFDKTSDAAHLDQAEAYVTAAREVFEEAGASHYLTMADDQLAKITQRRQSR